MLSCLKIEVKNIHNFTNFSDSLLKKYKDFYMSLNKKGGKKICTLGTFQVFNTGGKVI